MAALGEHQPGDAVLYSRIKCLILPTGGTVSQTLAEENCCSQWGLFRFCGDKILMDGTITAVALRETWLCFLSGSSSGNPIFHNSAKEEGTVKSIAALTRIYKTVAKIKCRMSIQP